MNVENVDVVRAQLLEGRLDGDVHGLDAVPGVRRHLGQVLAVLEVDRVL